MNNNQNVSEIIIYFFVLKSKRFGYNISLISEYQKWRVLMRYDKTIDNQSNWVVEEDIFDNRYLGKCEAIMYQGNGYLGIRATTEETYLGEVRNTFISGTFNKFDVNEVTELPNVADVIQMDIFINGQKMNLIEGTVRNYSRYLNLKNGELVRAFVWISPNKEEIEFTFKRTVSLKNKHVVAQRVELKPLNSELELKLRSGINAQMTNSGVQHFTEGEKRLFDGKYMQLRKKTTESKIDFVINTTHIFFKNEKEVEPKSLIFMDRRKIYSDYTEHIGLGDNLTVEKISTYHTSRDKDFLESTLEEIVAHSLKLIRELRKAGYHRILSESATAWDTQVWSKAPIEVTSEDQFDQLAVRFAQYHLRVMTPFHDNRMSVAAKGLSGEGYKGHVFWDTEIFILPYFTFTNPKKARNLLEYRYLTIEGARKKAKDNGYEGAMYPWESAWKDDGEVTPVWGAADIVTGKATKIWSGFIEQHITSDIAFAIWQYYNATGDTEFMELYGYEMIFEIAKFWSSRVQWDHKTQSYHINNVIGPDEYKEHVNNNAFTNYMAKLALDLAIEYYLKLQDSSSSLFDKFDYNLKIKENFERWCEVSQKIYLPKPNEQLVIPQDDTYLHKKIIDLTKYKNQQQVGSIFKDYNLEQVNEIQVSKQADIMVLFYLLEHLFDKNIKVANWNYYEPKTLHDSSLSLSIHCILASDLGDKELSYKLFKEAAQIDLGTNMKSSDHGIHAASIGGIWQCVVNGFGGVRLISGSLRIEPALPEKWSRLTFTINFKGDKIKVIVSKEMLIIEKLTNKNGQLEIEHKGKNHVLKDKLVFHM